MRFAVDDAVFEKLRNVCFGVVVARGVDNTERKKEIKEILDNNVEMRIEQLCGVKIKEHAGILPYRNAFTKIGFNPNKYPCSVEALITRVIKGGQMPSINNVVDIANAISIKYILPIGAHDIDAAEEDIMVRYSVAGDKFIPFGMEVPEYLEPGELVYARGSDVKTRRWIWRQSERGKITEKSTNIFFPIDGFRDSNYEEVISARDELAHLLKELFNCKVATGYVDMDNKAMQL
jgi:DNA/RNA-binding domain of Phe-tRNA-synthetase-like protein